MILLADAELHPIYPLFQVLFQIDQHDCAVRNQATLTEHPHDLDIPSWHEQQLARGAAAGRMAEATRGIAG